jgi:uncharacterized protein
MMDDGAQRVAIGRSEFGRGLFAKKSIAEGTILFHISGDEIRFADTLNLQDAESHALQVDFDKYILLQPPVVYCNHSCQPNCGISHDLHFITIRPVRKGEELFWDYSTSMLERHWTMPCKCGSTNCRQLVTDFDLLPQRNQQWYICKGIVLPFIIQYLQQDLRKSA